MIKPTFFRLINAEDVASLLAMDELIDAMEQALRRFSLGQVVQPVRTVIPIGDQEFFGVMPAFVQEPQMLGAKLVTVFGKNAALDLPTHLASVLLLSPHTGALVAVMDSIRAGARQHRGHGHHRQRSSGAQPS
jgi:ornithine cyclodeaminase/alanine dehydrogenase-like protein (mu-crystallin family)